jgi:hypothetical protein
MIGSIIFLMVVSLGIGKMVYDHQLAKEKEFDLRLKNKKLLDYWIEANSDYNDGWTKEHYSNLYYETKELLYGQKEKKES